MISCKEESDKAKARQNRRNGPFPKHICINYTRITLTMKKIATILLLLLLVTTLIYFPILVNPDLLLERSNDLQEQFWPVFYFIRQNFLENRQIPLWNNLFFSGTPILPDPQFSLFYPPNAVFLLLPTNQAFITYFLAHTFLAGLGAYILTKRGLNLSKTASIITALLYILTPKLAGYIEAGHYGLLATHTWLPYASLAALKLIKKPQHKWSVLLGISLAALFYTHTVIFILTSVISATIFATFLLFTNKGAQKIKSFLFFGASALTTFGLIAIAFLPQLEWAPFTTRFLLLENRDVYPKWNSIKEFFLVIFLPWFKGKESIWAFDSEKWLVLGIPTSLLALIGLWGLKRKTKTLILLLIIISFTLLLNNISPFYPILISQDWYALMRVTSRFWFIPLFIFIFLAGFGVERLIKRKTSRNILVLLVFLAIFEGLMLSWVRIKKPFSDKSRFAPQEVYEYLQKDKERFRVFCINRCLSQKQAAKARLELVEGYNTLQQRNYYQQTWQLMGGYWNYYTLAIPPIGAYKYEKLQPDAVSLGEYNTKYVISPHELEDENFILEKEIDNFLIYRNTLVKPRANAPITICTPNHIRIDTNNFLGKQIILSEVYNPGWKAYLNGVEKVSVQETPVALRAVDINPDTQFVDFKYSPNSYVVGKVITLGTIIVVILMFCLKQK